MTKAPILGIALTAEIATKDKIGIKFQFHNLNNHKQKIMLLLSDVCSSLVLIWEMSLLLL